MKKLSLVAAFPIAVTVFTKTPPAFAVSVKVIYADQAQGETKDGMVKFTVFKGYDLVLSFMKLGETVTGVRLSDPSHIAFGSNGVLCPPKSSGDSGENSCLPTGVNVIFFRLLAGNGISFPYLTSSNDGGTQATIFTNGPNGQRMYPILLNLSNGGSPLYTTVVIKPQEDSPTRGPRTLPVPPPISSAPVYSSIPPAPSLRSHEVAPVAKAKLTIPAKTTVRSRPVTVFRGTFRSDADAISIALPRSFPPHSAKYQKAQTAIRALRAGHDRAYAVKASGLSLLELTELINRGLYR